MLKGLKYIERINVSLFYSKHFHFKFRISNVSNNTTFDHIE